MQFSRRVFLAIVNRFLMGFFCQLRLRLSTVADSFSCFFFTFCYLYFIFSVHSAHIHAIFKCYTIPTLIILVIIKIIRFSRPYNIPISVSAPRRFPNRLGAWGDRSRRTVRWTAKHNNDRTESVVVCLVKILMLLEPTIILFLLLLLLLMWPSSLFHIQWRHDRRLSVPRTKKKKRRAGGHCRRTTALWPTGMIFGRTKSNFILLWFR